MKADDVLNNCNSPWHNVYWFARMFINRDKYVPIGKEPKLLASIASSLRVISQENKNKKCLNLQKQTLFNSLKKRYTKTKSYQQRLARTIDELDKKILTKDDIDVFILTCENIMLPLNQAIANVPSDDKEFTLNIAKSYLDVQGSEGLATVITLWDDLGVKGCLTAERTEIIKAFTTLRTILKKDISISTEDMDIVLTAFVQEFERRIGQKRKQRAGGSLEDVTNFILGYYDIKQAKAPEHFQADIEVDNWVSTKDGWCLGISCKRTLRERWKQVSSAESVILSNYKIKYIFHIITYDEDLSDDKLTTLGGHRHIFFLPDNSRRLKHAKQHIGLKDYVRPISTFIEELKSQVFG